jgi:hypothetical protein
MATGVADEIGLRLRDVRSVELRSIDVRSIRNFFPRNLWRMRHCVCGLDRVFAASALRFEFA